jgi:hypothetical protein
MDFTPLWPQVNIKPNYRWNVTNRRAGVCPTLTSEVLRGSCMLAWAIAVPGGAGHPGRADAWLDVLLPRSSTVEVAASASAICLWPELAFQLHQAPDPGAVGAQIGLDVGRRLTDSGQVDIEQLRAPLLRRRDRPAQVWVVPSPHPSSLSNARVRDPIGYATDRNRTDRLGHLGAQSIGPHGSTADNPGKALTW